MKKKLIAIVIVLVFTTQTFGSLQSAVWEKFNSSEGRFSILVPSTPKPDVNQVDSAVGELTVYSYNSSNSVGLFVVTYTDYPFEANGADHIEAVLDGVRKGVLEGSGADLIDEKKILQSSYPGRVFRARKTVNGAAVIFNWKVVLVGRRLYQLAIATNVKDSKSPDIARYLDSFELKK
jgi:hypothetical protein